jgi:transposase
VDTKTRDKLLTRRQHSAEFKAQVVAQCNVPGASVVKVAMSHGINDNLVHGWRKLAREAALPAVVATGTHAPQFLTLPLPTPRAAAAQTIDVELRRGAVTMKITWPATAADELAAFTAVWLATAPLDMRAGAEAGLAAVVKVFGAAHLHHAYCFANRRASGMTVLVHDGMGHWGRRWPIRRTKNTKT